MKSFNRFKTHRMPEQSVFYDHLVPAMLILCAVMTAALILFALGVLTGIVVWS